MKRQFFTIICLIFITSCATQLKQSRAFLPGWMKGTFTDDYGSTYIIDDTLLWQKPSARYHILKWDKEKQYLLVKNDENNLSEKGLYSRIDYMEFKNMQPYSWGFCLSIYDAKDTLAALTAPSANRDTPKKGCNGYPFTRMKLQAK